MELSFCDRLHCICDCSLEGIISSVNFVDSGSGINVIYFDAEKKKRRKKSLGGTYLGRGGYPTLAGGGYLPWPGGTYLGQEGTYLVGGGYLPWLGWGTPPM